MVLRYDIYQKLITFALTFRVPLSDALESSYMKEYELIITLSDVTSLIGNTRNTSASFPALTWERGQFFVFLQFSDFGLQYLQEHSSKSFRIYS